MHFSALQQYIIRACCGGREKTDRKIFFDFYKSSVISTKARLGEALASRAKRNGEIPLAKLRDSSCPTCLDGSRGGRAAPFRSARNDKTKIITKSLERLIDKGMLVGYGVRTPKKWFIKEVRITHQGRKIWESWLNRKQRKLPV